MVSITPVQNNSKKSQPTFGMDFTRSTPKLLKKISPQLVEDGNLSHAKTAIKNIAALTQKNDGYIVKIAQEDRTSESLDILVKTKDLKHFAYADSCVNPTITESLAKLVEYLSGNEFITDAIDTIQRDKEYYAKKKFKDNLATLKEMAQEVKETFTELPDIIGGFCNRYLGTLNGFANKSEAKQARKEAVSLMLDNPKIVINAITEKRAEVKALKAFIDEQFSKKKA